MATATGWWEVTVYNGEYGEVDTTRYMTEERARSWFDICVDNGDEATIQFVDPTSMDDIPF